MTVASLSLSYPDFKLSEVIDPEQFDLNNLQLVNKINEIRVIVNQMMDSVVDGTSGADNISLTPIIGFVSTKLQAYLEEVQAKLISTGGSGYIGSATIAGVTGNTVFTQLSSLKTLLDSTINTHKTAAVLDHPDGSVTTAKIIDAGVTTVKLADANVTLGKLAPNSVDASKIVDASVGTAELADLGVTTAKLGNLNVTTAKIADLGITTAKLGDLSVTTGKIADVSVTGGKIAPNTITQGNIASQAIGTALIADGAITASKLDPAIAFSSPDIVAHNADILAHNSTLTEQSSVYDATNKVYTVVTYLRVGSGTTYMKSTLSNLSSGNYLTDTWLFYDTDGSTVVKTITWTLVYDASGLVTSKTPVIT